MPIDKMRINLV